jgi:hypothetical protein
MIGREAAKLTFPAGKKVLMPFQDEPQLNAQDTPGYSPIARIFQLGRDKSYVTYADILRYIPEPERDLDLVDRVFAVLLCADIPYGEDAEHLMDEEEFDL